MNIIVGRGMCWITFGEEDGEYSGKELKIPGEGNGYNKDFWICNPVRAYWSVPDETNPGQNIEIPIKDEEEKKKVITYVIEKSKEQGYLIYL